KVVSMAVLFLADTSRRAIVRRMRLIFSRRSTREKATGAAAGAGVGFSSGATGRASGLDSGDPDTACTASALVMRPSLPVPVTASWLTLPSRRILAAAGDG